MLLKTLINRRHKFKYFKYNKKAYFDNEGTLIINLLSKDSAKPRCSKCQKICPGYDRQKERGFLFVPLWGNKVKIIYRPRRVRCEKHGIIIEHMPWTIGKRPVCRLFACFLAKLSKKLSWKDVAEMSKTSWDIVYVSVKYVVDYGLARRQLEDIKQIGIDEIKVFKKGKNKFVTLVFETTKGSKRLLWIGENRKAKTLYKFFALLGKNRYQSIVAVSSDMWSAYLKVIKKKLPTAIHVLDRFHIMKKFSEAIDDMRRLEFEMLKNRDAGNILKNTRWIFLKKPENLTENQSLKLKDLASNHLMTYKAYLMRESFQRFWDLPNKRIAKIFMHVWMKMVSRTKIEPMKKVAATLKNHQDLILNWFAAEPKISNATVEGFNNKAKLILRKAYGYRSFEALKVALYHNLGNLPEPDFAHRLF